MSALIFFYPGIKYFPFSFPKDQPCWQWILSFLHKNTGAEKPIYPALQIHSDTHKGFFHYFALQIPALHLILMVSLRGLPPAENNFLFEAFSFYPLQYFWQWHIDSFLKNFLYLILFYLHSVKV